MENISPKDIPTTGASAQGSRLYVGPGDQDGRAAHLAPAPGQLPLWGAHRPC